jgi:Tfp pilus assembly protein PilV
MPSFPTKRWSRRRASVGRCTARCRQHPPAGDQDEGFAIIEVIISALIVGLIVVATFNGFAVANRVTSDERSHAQADALAQQDEERLRGKQVSVLNGLNETREVTYGGTKYTITSKGGFISDATATESCTAGASSADYIRTTSEVGWSALKSRAKVVETGLITPHLGGSLLVHVTNASGSGVPGMNVTATGPSPSASTETATTGSNGCAIFSSVEPGEYTVTTSQTGYVEKDGNSEPPLAERTATVTNGVTTSKEFLFDRGGELSVSFENPSTKAAVEGDSFLALNTSMTLPSYKTFGTLGTFGLTVKSPKTLFPFTGAYTVYAGSCPADEPVKNGQASDPNPPVPGVAVAGGAPTAFKVPAPPIAVKVMSGTAAGAGTEGSTMAAAGTLTDTGCQAEGITAVRNFTTVTATGALPHPNMPYGTYSLCVTAVINTKARKYTTTGVTNNKTTGVPLTTIYLGNGTLASGCP